MDDGKIDALTLFTRNDGGSCLCEKRSDEAISVVVLIGRQKNLQQTFNRY